MNGIEKIMVGALCVGLGAIGGILLGEHVTRHELKKGSAYSIDLNGDGINDILIKGLYENENSTLIYLGQEDGTFKNLYQIKGELEDKVAEIEENDKRIE